MFVCIYISVFGLTNRLKDKVFIEEMLIYQMNHHKKEYGLYRKMYPRLENKVFIE